MRTLVETDPSQTVHGMTEENNKMKYHLLKIRFRFCTRTKSWHIKHRATVHPWND